MTSYNPWYLASYEPIFEMCNWEEFSLDIEKKIVCVFAWMPQAIMNVTDSGKGQSKRTKAMVYDPDGVQKEIEKLRPFAGFFKGKKLIDTNLNDLTVKDYILELCEPIFKIFGSVAGSKFLHFSYPHFFIMWDRGLRLKNKLSDSPNGYYEYLKIAQAALRNEKILTSAQKEYSSNPVRGLDVYWMKAMRDNNDKL